MAQRIEFSDGVRFVTSPRSDTRTLVSLAVLFLRIGNLTFGGGDAITATLQRELVHRRRWLDLERYGLAQSLAKITPGTGILAFSAATAWMLRRWSGAIAAVLAVSVPSAGLVVLLTWGFTSLGRSEVAHAIVAPVLASAVGMIWAAAWLLVRPQLRRGTWLRSMLIVVSGFAAGSRWSFSPVLVIAIAAMIGLAWTGESPERATETQ